MVVFPQYETLYPAPQHVPGLQGVQPVQCNPTGCRLPGVQRTSISSLSKQQPLHNPDTGLSQWEKKITKMAEVQKKGERWRNSVFYVHVCTFNNSGICLTAWSLH